MASGLPVIIPFSANKSQGELGESVIYSENNPTDFSKNINNLLVNSELQKTMSEKSSIKAKEFDSSILENREAEIYLELISNKK